MVNAKVKKLKVESDCARECSIETACVGFAFAVNGSDKGDCHLYGQGLDEGLTQYQTEKSDTISADFWKAITSDNITILATSGDDGVVCKRKTAGERSRTGSAVPTAPS